MNKIQKVLVANRGEIALRIMQACEELDIKTVAIYSKEDYNSQHRFKADEAFLVGEDKSPTAAYLDIENIIKLAKENDVDAIHPGYGFLSENLEFAKRCGEEGIKFVGPNLEHLEMFGNKTRARDTAIEAGLKVVPGTDGAIDSVQQVKDFAEEHDYPIMIKAVSGGGGKGMRIIREEAEVQESYDRAKSEAMNSFGDDSLYVEKFIENPKHIEVQILGDEHGNIVHLFERDCSVQRRHQKVVEVAPSFSLADSVRENLAQAALQLAQNINYINAGTVEFLVSGEDFYFIEVNPRVQVEHTITELVTGIDIVKSQLLVADGENLHEEKINIPQQEDITTAGYAVQCRVTTEDPANDFAPDSGRIVNYVAPSGIGVRLDQGNAHDGAVISPHYDSLLVKICTYGESISDVLDKTERALDETRIVGLKTNIAFLKNIIKHPLFKSGDYSTNLINNHPELFKTDEAKDRDVKLINYLANVTVNGFPGISDDTKPKFETRQTPIFKSHHTPVLGGIGDVESGDPTLKHILDKEGPDAVVEAILSEKDALITDTTLRDAHQSILTTRLRTRDMLEIAPYINATMKDSFSLEMWGGATFDVAYNFLNESPWDRLEMLRQAIPDIPFQMLLRASNAVGYKNYPDNVIKKFIEQSAEDGIDVFRIFDSLNWMETLKLPLEVALETGKLVEGTVCYTGDILDPERSSTYTLDYYVNMAKELESYGVHTLGIKDMSGILKPEAAYLLVKTLKDEVNIPIHLHMHDTAGNAVTAYSRAIDAGVDIVDVANAAISGTNSQPDGNALYYARQGKDRGVKVNPDANDEMEKYWSTTRQYYKPFESDLVSPWTGVYKYEMPGGQYSNILAQARSVGLGDRFDEVLDMYRRVNLLFGDIIKVTPSSKVVGDMSLFMVQNDLNEETVISEGKNLDFPDSVVSFMKGEIGQTVNGFNKELQDVIVKNGDIITDRPGNHIPAYDYEAAKKELLEIMPEEEIDDRALLSNAIYPKVFKDYIINHETFDKIEVLDSPSFFYGLELGEEIDVTLRDGKQVTIKYLAQGPVKEDGQRTMFYSLNGKPVAVEIIDHNLSDSVALKAKADKTNPKHVGAQMPGTVLSISCKVGDEVKQNDTIIVTEAMKMESAIHATSDGVIKEIYVSEGEQIEGGDLLIEFE